MESWVSLPEAHRALSAAGWTMERSSRNALIYVREHEEVALAVRLRDGVHVGAEAVLHSVDGVRLVRSEGTDLVSLEMSDVAGDLAILERSGFDGDPPDTELPAAFLFIKRGNADQDLVDRLIAALERFERAAGDPDAAYHALDDGGVR